MWPRADGKTQQAIVFCFEAEIAEGIPHPCDRKVAEVRWFPKTEIETLDALVGITEFIKLRQEAG